MKIKLVVIGMLLFGSTFFGYGQLKGKVFLDHNKNGIKESKEKGVRNAVVSDGYHVVRTDDKGNFELPGWEKQRFVTIYPNGSFNSEKRFIPITSKLKSYDFPVQTKKQKEEVNFLQISDTETFEYGDWVDNLKKYIKVHKPDFVVHTGDICYKAGMEWHADNLTEKELGVPIYYCLGNHDLVKGDYGEQFFEEKFGPAWYAVEEGNTLFVITPMMGGDFPPGFNHEDIGGWLQNLLKAYDKDQPKIFFNHDLLTDGESFVFKKNDNESIVLEDYNLKSWLYGHWHINMVKTHGASGVVSYSTATLAKGGIDHSPSSFRAIKVDKEGNTKSQLIWSHLEREIQIVSPQKNELTLNNQGEVEVSVNVYDSGSVVDSVRYSIWGKEGFNWESSRNTSKWKAMVKTSDWNWRATFPPSAEKDLLLVVDAYLRSGEVLHRKEKFRLEDRKEKRASKGEWSNLAGNKEHHPVVDMKQQAPYTMEWTANVGSNIYMSSPVIKDNYVLTAGFDDSNAENCFIVCWDASAGRELWRYKTKNGVKNQMVIAQDKVIATDMIGHTYAIDIASGKLVWDKDLKYNRAPGFITGLVTDGKIVYTGYSDSLSAIEVNTGRVLWQNKAWKGGEGTTPTMTIADNVLLASRHWGAIYAHDRFTGELLWSRNDDGLRFRDGVLSYKDKYLWVAEQDKLHQLDLKTGKTVHSFITGMQHTGTSAPIVLQDRVIISGSHPGVASFDLKTGKKQWEFQVDPALFYTPSYFSDQQQSLETTPILVGENLIFGAMDGKVYVVNAVTGSLVWKTALGAPLITSAAISADGFFICDFAGNIYFFKTS
ncbi:PQQ-binding-like beta-propeller repeat protein [Arenibacter sp. 6A1]|uniref:outer membrane protein assembly factor BamB family protein n=1 Tax=Arenibacter sp. 6A1 TaxID=2720391 RepID=UPI0014488F11|nr:PQQ-binding-like beta-propeller repeat protein [Arenibacter sp. 6A1]NKI27589.1 PQQ-binding-like beta-propeller repeat protein [Arenibacter sp. 6A1]